MEDVAEKHATNGGTISQDDVSLLFGTVNLLECVAAECDRAYRGEGAA